jgi:hypothetical protein
MLEFVKSIVSAKSSSSATRKKKRGFFNLDEDYGAEPNQENSEEALSFFSSSEHEAYYILPYDSLNPKAPRGTYINVVI